VSADNAVFWMDREEFYVYTGRVQPPTGERPRFLAVGGYVGQE